MQRKFLFDAIRRLLGRGFRQREVSQIDAAIDAALSAGGDPPRRAIGPAGIALIQRFEGCGRRRADGCFGAYSDPGSSLSRTGSGSGAPWTIGWGATGPEIGPGTVWTQAQCDARLADDLVRYAGEVDAALGDAPTTQTQFDALVSFHYNTGAIARATLTRRHLAGDFTAAAAEFARWNRAGGRLLKGLARRRAAEAQLYRSGLEQALRRNPGEEFSLVERSGENEMFRLLGAAALALTATNPLFAQGKGGDHPRGDHPGRGAGQPASVGAEHSKPPGDRGRGAEKPARAANHARPDRRSSADHNQGGDAKRAREAVIRADFRDGRGGYLGDRGGGDGGDGRIERDRFYASVPSCPPGLAKKRNGCLPPGLARQARDAAFGHALTPALFGFPLRAAADYVYYDGYLIPAGDGGSYLPLLGGALAVGQVWPDTYPSLPLSNWQRDYYGFDEAGGYRYADNVVYQVDPATSVIETVVALLTGSDFAVGEALPAGYDIYNVPAAYHDRYADSDEALYRYADGRIYEVDPVTMLIERAIELVA